MITVKMKFLIIRNFQTRIVMLLRKSFEIGENINLGVCIRAKEQFCKEGKEELYAHMPSQIGNVVMA